MYVSFCPVLTIHADSPVTVPSAQEAQPSEDRKQPSPWRQCSELMSCGSITGAHTTARNVMASVREVEICKAIAGSGKECCAPVQAVCNL